jgi:hypothetical protein
VLNDIDYLEFADTHFGRAEHDLAVSGIAPIGPAELGANVSLTDWGARERFTQAVATRYGVPAPEVVPCVGASGGVYAVCRALLEPGAGVLVESPAYEPLWRIPQGLGAELAYFERSRAQGFVLDPDRIVQKLTPATRLVIVTNPHNPSAALTDDATLARLAAELATQSVHLLVDEVYLELFRPRQSARRLGRNVIACSSATKCWGAPWARAGWLLSDAQLRPKLALVEHHVMGQAPPACWAWGERAVLAGDALLERAHQLQLGKRALVDRFVERLGPELSWCAPAPASLFGWLEARTAQPLDSRLEQAHRRHGVLVAPGRFFGVPSAFRISWATPAERLAPALSSLEQALCINSDRPA